ncbi:MAG: nucleotidyltransferase domain-containing protein [Planctomycetota bacterium]
MGTIVTNMGTDNITESISAVLFGKTRRAVLNLMFTSPEQSFYLREIVRLTGMGQGAVQRELNQLTESGILQRLRRGHQVFFQANQQCPVYAELQKLILKTTGAAEVIKQALDSLAGRIRVAFIYGSFTGGQPTAKSDVDLCVVGKVSFAKVAEILSPAQETIGREINPTVYKPKEFAKKLKAGHHFISSIVRGPKIVLLGDKSELKAMANR